MKKVLFLMIGILVLGLVFAGCSEIARITTPSTTQEEFTYLTKGGPTEEEAESFPLYAGQDWLVGEVLVWDDGEKVCVKYMLDPEVVAEGWGLTETHLAIVTDPADVPQTEPKKGEEYGNPKVGHFPYGNDALGGVAEDGPYCVYFGDIGDGVGCEETLVIAAHAVVSRELGCNEIGDVYGIQRNTGKVFGINVTTGENAEIFTTVNPPVGSATPNGLAYDGENKRMYYCDYQTTTTLYFWDGTKELIAGSLPGEIAAADFDEGKYYFITGPPASDDLYEVTFEANGTIKNMVKLADIADNNHGWTFSGDIAVKEGIVYGWGYCGKSGHGYEFFTYDLYNKNFYCNKTDYQSSLQLAFGLDGQLYGHRSGGSGEFFVVNTTDGTISSAVCNTGGILFTDCASGAVCIPDIESETAWGATEDGGIRFVDKGNWATYFEYIVECSACLGCPGILEKSNNIEILATPPSDVTVNALVNNNYIRVWKEFQGELAENLYYDLADGDVAKNGVPKGHSSYMIPAGTNVCIYYVHYDQEGGNYTQSEGINANITFDEEIMGLIISGGTKGDFAEKDLMFAADDIIGDSGTTYPTKAGDNRERGFDVNWSINTDDVVFSKFTVKFNVWVANAHDSFRVILPLAEVPCD